MGLLAGHPKIIRAAASADNSKATTPPELVCPSLVSAELWVRVGVAVRWERIAAPSITLFGLSHFRPRPALASSRSPAVIAAGATRFFRVDRRHGLHQTIRELNVR